MKKIGLYLMLVYSMCSTPLFATETPSCTTWATLLKPACQRLHQVWTEGKTDLYLSGYAWHNRYTYPHERIKTFNEQALGGGFGKGLFNENGNWHGLYAFAFLDSHRHVEPVVGYDYLKIANLSTNIKAGLGYTLLVTSRVDIFNNIPFPGILPWAGVFYKRASIAATYIPGSSGAGNVLFIVGKYTL
jgi:palmitoyl transferase